MGDKFRMSFNVKYYAYIDSYISILGSNPEESKSSSIMKNNESTVTKLVWVQ